MSLNIRFLPEEPAHDAQIEQINAEAFGPGRFARAAYKIREAGPHDSKLSFVALHEDEVVASVRQTWIMAGEGRALLLGPLAVRPVYKNKGIGRKLVRIALDAAREADAGVVVLVGDEPYYGPLGFKRIPNGQITMPRPVDANRLLAVELQEGALARLTGRVVHAGVPNAKNPLEERASTVNRADA
ncbi:GNAT family N-acetyltransferase [Chelativorans sp. YIM 93263]|uniref:GNAT family N-acetyltransferase n=1 Tax=Chelativorans sp. YIM 93263 TaxID=2906648 RepID=UPI002378B225|nr:N-acetyltransferase [Chelativorans sp. YIM 93263]